jgi:hypothetical protein
MRFKRAVTAHEFSHIPKTHAAAKPMPPRRAGLFVLRSDGERAAPGRLATPPDRSILRRS